MGGPAFDITEDGRFRLAKFLGIAHWICILPSVLCLILALFIQISIEDKISFLEDYNGAVLPGFLIFTGFYGLVAHTMCGKIAYTNRVTDKREKWSQYLFPVVIATLIIFVSEFISGIMCFAHISNLEDGFDSGIMRTIAAYKDDATAKEQLDVLQFSYGCCGSRSYLDWFTINWVHPDYAEETSSTKNVPFSCCNPEVLRPCIRKRVHDNSAHYKYDYEQQTTLYEIGCTEILMDFFSSSVLTVAGGLVLSLSFIQLGTSVAGRLLQTAIISSMEGGGPEEPSKAYLFTAPNTDGNETMTTATEGDTLLDTTAETTFTQDTAGEDRYVDMSDGGEPLYENVPPYDEEEHIYNEQDVEDYLAAKYADSRDRFEYDTMELPSPTEVPIYDEIVDYRRSAPSLTKVRSHTGNYMSMDRSNSSRIPEGYGRNGSCFADDRTAVSYIHKHPYPSPELYGARPKTPLVIDMGHYFSSEKPKVLPRHSSPKRKKRKRRDRSFGREFSNSSERHHLLPDKWRVKPVIGGISVDVEKPKHSPRKGRRSPQRRVSPAKTSFRSGISHCCNHALE